MYLSYIKKYINKALMPTIVITMIFFLNYFLFGMENTLIGPFATLSFLRFKNHIDHYSCMVKTFFIYFLISIIAYIALLNIVLCIIINVLALFWICYILIDEYNPTNYFPSAMALIFFQMSPVKDLHGLSIRWLALLSSFLIIFLFIFALFKTKSKNTIYLMVKEGMKISGDIIDILDGEDLSTLKGKQNEIHALNDKISTEIYLANKASLVRKVKVNRYCLYVSYFQTVNYIAGEFLNPDQKTNDGYSKSEGLEIIRNFQNNLSNAIDSDILLTDIDRINFRDLKFDLRSFRLRFALRIIIAVTPCLVLAYIEPLYNTYWLVISVFFMMIPVFENTFKRVADRTKGTIVGLIICIILYTIFTDLPARIIIMTIANFFIYTAESYTMMVVYITCSALALLNIDGNNITVFAQRLIYTIIGGIITFFANRFIFPIKSADSIEYIKELLNEIRMKIDDFYVLKSREKRLRVNKVIIKSYLLSSRLEAFNEALGDKGDIEDIKRYQNMHMRYIADWVIKGKTNSKYI